MNFNYSKPGEVKVDMTDYIKSMIEEFPKDIGKAMATLPSNENLFKVNTKSPELRQEKAEQFHTVIAKGLFACKRARPDIQPTIAFLCTRVKSLTVKDWGKLQ